MTTANSARPHPGDQAGNPRTAASAMLVTLLCAAALFLAWMAADALLLIFGGLLLAALLDACTRGLSSLLPTSREWNLTIVTVTAALAVLGLAVWSGFSIAQQINSLVDALSLQLDGLKQSIAALGIGPPNQSGPTSTADYFTSFLFPNPHQLFGEAQSAFTKAMGGIGEAILVVLIGVFVAADPPAYRRGLLELLPLRHRERAGFVLDETALFLRRWLVGQLAAMLLLAVLTWLVLFAVGVPSALLLAVLAGLFNFVPYLGAIGGGVPVLLMALPMGTTPVLIALGLFTVIHIGVGYVVVPLIQKQAVHLPPALTLASLIIFGALFGLASIVVATPLIGSIRHAFRRLHQAGPARPRRRIVRQAQRPTRRSPRAARRLA